MGDLPGHAFRGNQWTTSSGHGVRVDPSRIDKLSLAENKAEMRELAETPWRGKRATDERRATSTGAVQRGDWGARVAPQERKGWERD